MSVKKCVKKTGILTACLAQASTASTSPGSPSLPKPWSGRVSGSIAPTTWVPTPSTPSSGTRVSLVFLTSPILTDYPSFADSEEIYRFLPLDKQTTTIFESEGLRLDVSSNLICASHCSRSPESLSSSRWPSFFTAAIQFPSKQYFAPALIFQKRMN